MNVIGDSDTDRGLRRRLAFGVFASPVAWFVCEVASVAVVGRQCPLGNELAAWQWTALVALSLGAAAVALAAGLTCHRIFTRRSRGVGVTHAEGHGVIEFAAIVGMVVSALLLLNIIYFGVMPFVVEPCLRTI